MNHPRSAPPRFAESLARFTLVPARALRLYSLGVLASITASAQLFWDTDPIASGLQAGSGAWNDPLRWSPSVNGGSNQGWVSGSDALFNFGGNANPHFVDVGSVTLDDLHINLDSNYTLQNGTLTFGGADGTAEIRGSGSLTISATIAGSNGLTLPGDIGSPFSSVVLSGANTYTGTTTIETGRGLIVDGGTAVPDSSRLVFQGGALTVRASETVGSVSGTAGITVQAGAILKIGADGTSTSLNGMLSGSGGLEKIGSGTLLVAPTATVNYTGPTVVTEGTLSMPRLSSASPVTIASGASLGIGFAQTIQSLVGNGVLAMGTNALTLLPSSFGGTITGSGGITLNNNPNSSDFALAGQNSFTGALTINNSKLFVPSVANTGVASPLGTSGPIRLAGGELILTQSGSHASNRPFEIQAGGARFTLPTGTTLELAAPIGGSGTLYKSGPGVLKLAGVNTFIGIVEVTAGTLQVSGGNALPDSSEVLLARDATLQLLSDERVSRVFGGGSIELGGQKLTIGQVQGSQAGWAIGIVSGSGDSCIEIIDDSHFELFNVANTFSGGVLISSGIISVPSLANTGIPSPLGTSGMITLGDATHAGELYHHGTGSSSTDRPFTISPGGGKFRVLGTLDLSGPISGSGPVVKWGPGRLQISSRIEGPISIMEGWLTVNTESDEAPGPITVLTRGGSRYGVLDSPAGSTRTIGELRLEGGMIAPGGSNQPGEFLTGNITLQTGFVDIDLLGASPGSYDTFDVTGTISMEGAVELSIRLGYDVEDWVDSFRIFENDGADPLQFENSSSRFIYRGNQLQGNLLEDGEHFLVRDGAMSQWFFLRYGGESGNDIDLVAAPEPGSIFLLLGGAGLVIGKRRRNTGFPL